MRRLADQSAPHQLAKNIVLRHLPLTFASSYRSCIAGVETSYRYHTGQRRSCGQCQTLGYRIAVFRSFPDIDPKGTALPERSLGSDSSGAQGSTSTLCCTASTMVLPTTPALLTLLITNATLDSFNQVRQSCLVDRYYGTYGDQSLFMVDPNLHCDPFKLKLDLDWQWDLISVHPDHELLFLKKMEIEDAISGEDTLIGGLERLVEYTSNDPPAASGAQWPLIEVAPTYSILYHAEHSAILSISPHLLPYIDNALPPSYKAYALPKIPLPSRRVPEEAKRRIRLWTDLVEYDDDVNRIVEGLSSRKLRQDVRYLTGEDSNSPILSRSSFSEGGRLAAEWIFEQINQTGAECELKQFLPGFAPNVICKYQSLDESAGTIILSSHYDSRGSRGKFRAPGGDDNGSGTAAILSIARAIARNGIVFKSNVQLIAFAGEEQGLWGSRGYALELWNQGANITLMAHSDMLAYRVPGEPAQLAFPKIGTGEVVDLISKVASIYSPELVVGSTPACCSDHQTFHEQGFPAAQLFERGGPIADPMYHNSGDLSDREGYDFEQLRSITKALMATLLHTAEYELLGWPCVRQQTSESDMV
ncbi:hypothetical protein BJ322DRAFT_1040893 [Thelephora terrestris]|uniref:Peptide hydrolase n=1 Tax=Thelephora terrestris TaxID=56493 RepID=A0A9P6HNF7_9AGAM|nr:hypothetical protein BJ322DRAFT_1040893 [Thelephora terrestris]